MMEAAAAPVNAASPHRSEKVVSCPASYFWWVDYSASRCMFGWSDPRSNWSCFLIGHGSPGSCTQSRSRRLAAPLISLRQVGARRRCRYWHPPPQTTTTGHFRARQQNTCVFSRVYFCFSTRRHSVGAAGSRRTGLLLELHESRIQGGWVASFWNLRQLRACLTQRIHRHGPEIRAASAL